MNCRNTSFSSFAIANGPPVSGSHIGVPLTLNLYSEFICLTSSPKSSTGCDSMPFMIGSLPRISPSLKVFANLIRSIPFAPHSSRELQVCLNTSPSLTPGMITAAPVSLMFSQNIWQALSASSGLGSFTHSFRSWGSVENTVNETSLTPLFISLVAISESLIPFPHVYPNTEDIENWFRLAVRVSR